MKPIKENTQTPDFKAAFESSPGLFLILKPEDPDFTILGASDAYLKATKTVREQIVGKKLFEVFPDNPDDARANGTKNLLRSLQYVLKYKLPHNMVIQKYDIPRRDVEGGGFEERYWSPVNVPVLNDDGEVIFIIHSVKDVTELALYKRDSLEEIKAAREELEKKSAFIEENQERIRKILDIVLRYTTLDFSAQIAISSKGDELDAISVGLNTLGEELEAHIKKLREEEEKLSGLNADLEAKVIARTKEIANTERRYRALIENSTDAIVLLDKDTKPLYQSPSATRMLGLTLEERFDKPLYELVDDGDHVDVHKAFAEALENPGTPVPLNFRLINKDNTLIWAEGLVVNHLNDPSINALVVNYRDVTERKKAEDQQRLFTAIVNSSDDAIISKTLQGIITSWNHGAEVMFGYKPDEIIGKSVQTLIPENRRSEEQTILGKIRKGQGVQHYETLRVRKNGEQFHVSLTVSPIRDSTGSVVGASKILRDITERVKAEEEIRQLNATLEQRVVERTEQLQKVNKELEAFSYSVSHDLRAPLRAIDGYARIIEEDYIQLFDDEGKRLFSVIQYNAKKMGTLIDDLLAFSRLGRKELNTMAVDMNELVEGAILELEKSVEHHAEMKIGKLGTARVDYGLMSQVMINLISNAIKYSSKSKHPKVEINAERSEKETVYSVKDNGVGFDMKYAGKLFGVFQRLHSEEDFPGTGVGLAIVQRIINKHGGRVWAESTPGNGATFYFSLPNNN